jgi:hypothetical protein
MFVSLTDEPLRFEKRDGVLQGPPNSGLTPAARLAVTESARFDGWTKQR